MTKSHSVIIGASIVLGCLILGLTLNSPVAGQGRVEPSNSGNYQMMVAGIPGEFKVVVCNSQTGHCWSKSALAKYQDKWHPMGTPDSKIIVNEPERK
ncbi:MAG: hypothetical protein JWN70_1599 [Planctomycetaceae bacterium]|nr:hypothetical protein [Planctomycetaceae bacterium]